MNNFHLEKNKEERIIFESEVHNYSEPQISSMPGESEIKWLSSLRVQHRRLLCIPHRHLCFSPWDVSNRKTITLSQSSQSRCLNNDLEPHVLWLCLCATCYSSTAQLFLFGDLSVHWITSLLCYLTQMLSRIFWWHGPLSLHIGRPL